MMLKRMICSLCLCALTMTVMGGVRSEGLKELRLCGWRGERISTRGWITIGESMDEPVFLLLRAKQKKGKKLVESDGRSFANASSVRFISEVLTDSFNVCGTHPEGLPPYPVADIIETDTALLLKSGSTVPIWCTIEIPRDMKKGDYALQIEVIGKRTGRTYETQKLNVHVIDRELPPPAEQQFHVDFWQQPYAVSRYHQAERWSQQHFDLLRPYLQLLARAGQKVATAILFYEPWGDQSHDKFDAMIKSTRHEDGSWSYDYSVFDHWVELCDSCGINRQINCYSMIPWDMKFRFYQEAKEVELKTTTDSKEYADLWKPFLQAFAQHLKEKGWFENTCIAMDERGLKNMLDAAPLQLPRGGGQEVSPRGDLEGAVTTTRSWWRRFMTTASRSGSVSVRKRWRLGGSVAL